MFGVKKAPEIFHHLTQAVRRIRVSVLLWCILMISV